MEDPTDTDPIVVPLIPDCGENTPPTRQGPRPPNRGSQQTAKVCGAGAEDPAQASPTEILIAIAHDADLFHTDDGTGFADIRGAGHRETWRLDGPGFRDWLLGAYFRRTGQTVSDATLNTVVLHCKARARLEGPERPVFTRVGQYKGRIYLDLCDDTWRAVEIDADGWRLVDAPPIRFRRSKGMRPLPVPRKGGDIQTLRKYLNLRSKHDFVLVVSWMLAALRETGPYPVLVITGEQGSAKSTFVEFLRELIDPNQSAVRSLPNNDRDLFIAASNAHVLAFDNISRISPALSDSLCRLATGAGFATRKLHSDGDEALFQEACLIILNGIAGFVTRPDLADRAVFIQLPAISARDRKPLQQLKKELARDKAEILGAVLDAISVGLRQLPDTDLDEKPRMADFALWATACETAFGPEGTFATAFAQNQQESVADLLGDDPVAQAIFTLMGGREKWIGTATELFGDLRRAATENAEKVSELPRNARALSVYLERLSPSLRKAGIHIEKRRAHNKNRTRMMEIVREPPASGPQKGRIFASDASLNDAPEEKTFQNSHLGAGECRTQKGTDGGHKTQDRGSVRKNAQKKNGLDATDATDATDAKPGAKS